jgi:hypothetical protein
MKTNHIISGTVSTITSIHSKIVRLTSHEWWSIYGWFMTTFSASFEGEWPSFEDITLYQLCYWKVTCIYGLTQEEIKTLSTNPDPQTPSHHQVDPRIIKAYLTGESIPTLWLYLPGHLLSRHFGILLTFLPRDWFLPSELVDGPSGELERHYAFIHPPLPRFRRNRDRLHEKSTQTCQATQTWIFYFQQIIRWGQWAIWRFGKYRTDPTSFGHWLLWQNDCHRHLLWQ